MILTPNDRIAIGTGVTLTWISLAASYRKNPDFSEEQAWHFNPQARETVYATGGFPLKAYDYPMPPLGPGPAQSELPFIGNLIFWVALCYGALWLLRKRPLPAWATRLVLCTALGSTILGVVYLLLRFD